MPRIRSTAAVAAASGRDSASSAGAASSVNFARSDSNIVWSALPRTMTATDNRMRSGGVVRWIVARSGADGRIIGAPSHDGVAEPVGSAVLSVHVPDTPQFGAYPVKDPHHILINRF